MNCERMFFERNWDSSGDRAKGRQRRPVMNGYPTAISTVLITLMLVTWLGSLGHCDDVDSLIDQALKRSGIAGQVKEMIPAMLAAFPGDAFADSNFKRKVQRRVEAGLSDEALLTTVRDAVRKDFDRPKLEAVLAFYGSKLGRKVGHLQAGSLAGVALSDIREGRKALAFMPDARLALYKRIVRMHRVSQKEGKLFESMIGGLAAGSYGSPEEKAVAQGKLRSLIDRAGSRTEVFDQMAVAALARTFRSLSDEELEELGTFEESDAAQWFRKSVQPGLERIVYAIGRSLAAELREVRNQNGEKKR